MDRFRRPYARHHQLFLERGWLPLAPTDLIVDDWAMTKAERRDYCEICDRRYQVRSTLLTSQLSVNKWHAQITFALFANNASVGWISEVIRYEEYA